MSISSDRSTVNRLTREIADLRGKDASEVKKEADSNKKMNAANDQARRASSPGLRSMYANNALRESKNIEDAQARRSRHSNEIARKSGEVARLQERISKAEEAERRTAAAADDKRRKEDEKARKAAAAADARRQRDYEWRVNELESQIRAQVAATAPFTPTVAAGEKEIYDVFVSHAQKDKADFVDGLVEKARAAGLKVWYDDFAIRWGDPIRQKIDSGLAGSYFGVVVLSPNFFTRPWPNYELDGLIQKDLSQQGRLLPIWHRLTQDDVAKYAPSLAGRLALNTANISTDAIVAELVDMCNQFKAAAGGDPARG
ncbi:MAG TPA: toll/interleukin-1 receptor domain-containing protein [Allosphingosinicella sp.]|nr:toll/interleukin-1 receptor domain-containing protein [Allosphingosinicella sp.]